MTNYILKFTSLHSPPTGEPTSLDYTDFKRSNLGSESKGHVILFIHGDFSQPTQKIHSLVVQDDGSLMDSFDPRNLIRLARRRDVASVFNSITTPKKAKSCRENGRKGGRRRLEIPHQEVGVESRP